MAARYEITCINKPDRYSKVEAITHIGGVNSSSRWKLSKEEAIRKIENGEAEFFVKANNRTVEVYVVKNLFGKYLRTEPDDTKVDNLLSLPECL